MIYLLLIGFYVLLLLSLIVKDMWLGILSAMAVIILGIFVGVNGIAPINNLLTQAIAVISIGVGTYFFLAGCLISIQESGI